MTRIRKGQITSGAATDGQVLTADGSGNCDWEAPAGGTDENAIHDNVSGEINAIAEKESPDSTDVLIIEDSAASYAKKKVQITNLPAGGLSDHDHSGDAGDGGTFDAANLTSGAATDGYVLTADGSGGAAWEAASGGGAFTFAESTTTLGLDQNRNTGSTYTYLAQRIRILRPIRLDAVLWDIRAAGDYTLTIRDAENNILHTVLVEGIADASADVIFDLSPDVILSSGNYWFRMTVTGSAVGWSDYNINTVQMFSPFDINDQCDYDGTLSNFRAPIKLTYYDSSISA